MGVTGAEGRGKQSRSHTLRWTDRQVDVHRHSEGRAGGAVCVCVCQRGAGGIAVASGEAMLKSAPHGNTRLEHRLEDPFTWQHRAKNIPCSLLITDGRKYLFPTGSRWR